MMLLLLGSCVRGEAAPVPLIRTAAPRCWVCALSRRHGSALYTGHPLSHRSGPACVFPSRVAEAVEAAHVPVHPPK